MNKSLLYLFALVALSEIAVSLASQAAGQETLLGIVGRDFILLGADSSVSQGVALTASNLDKISPLVNPQLPPSEDRRDCSHQQQCIVAAAAGDAATSDRLIAMLQAQATIREYEAGIGCDVKLINRDHNQEKKNVDAGLTVQGMAYLARSQLSSIRPNANVCLLIAGMMYDASREKVVLDSAMGRPEFLSSQVQQQVQRAWSSGAGQEERKVDDSSGSSSSLLRPYLYWLDELGSLQQIQYGAHGLGSNFCLSVLDQGFRDDLSLEEATSLMRECFEQLRTRYLINSPQPPCIKVVDAQGVRLIR